MNIHKKYKTKSTVVYKIANGQPCLGWDGGHTDRSLADKAVIQIGPKENVVFLSTFKACYFSKGRSAVTFYFKSLDYDFQMTASAINKFLHLITENEFEHVEIAGEKYLRGFWTFSKQGSTVSAWPLSKQEVEDL